ncbi:MAG: glycosyltransferase family 2 protein [Myxococcota bacterium]
MKLLAVLVHKGSTEVTLESMRSLLMELEEIDAHIMLVDNALRDGSRDALAVAIAGSENPSRVTLVGTERPMTRAACRNLAVRTAAQLGHRAEYVYFLDPGVFPDHAAISALVQVLDAYPRSAIAGSYAYDGEGFSRATAFRFPQQPEDIDRGKSNLLISRAVTPPPLAIEPPNATGAVDWVSGSSMMIRTKALEELGLFDEELTRSFEEADFALRAKMSGWLCYYVPRSAVVDLGDGWALITQEAWDSSERRWFEKHARWLTTADLRPRLVPGLSGDDDDRAAI